mmetsp:Transcript_55450/g.82158  ORF Transcript_55450/g.82158 Transcript_55450/m.82158 type:complete len:225 (-) Transcript_55450:23-697(-)
MGIPTQARKLPSAKLRPSRSRNTSSNRHDSNSSGKEDTSKSSNAKSETLSSLASKHTATPRSLSKDALKRAMQMTLPLRHNQQRLRAREETEARTADLSATTTMGHRPGSLQRTMATPTTLVEEAAATSRVAAAEDEAEGKDALAAVAVDAAIPRPTAIAMGAVRLLAPTTMLQETNSGKRTKCVRRATWRRTRTSSCATPRLRGLRPAAAAQQRDISTGAADG